MRKFCMFAWRFAVVALLAANFLYTAAVSVQVADMPKPVAEMSRENIKAALGEIEFEVRPRMGSSRPKLTDTR
jgi:hypothetical protein